jgi:hypothetical protein
MTHLAFIIPSYAVALVIPALFALDAWRRVRAARARLAALEAGRRR